MIANFVRTSHLCKRFGRFSFALHQQFRTLTGTTRKPKNDLQGKTFQERNIFEERGTPGAVFQNISLVTPQDFTEFLYNNFKLVEVDSEKGQGTVGIKLLRNIAHNYDYWMVRKNQAHLLYYRMGMLLQRISFLKSIGLDSKQKVKQLQKYPPLLLFTFTGCSYTAKLVYLRGLVPQSRGRTKGKKNFIHMFYPISDKITADKRFIAAGVKKIGRELGIQETAVIRELLNIPCFFMDASCLPYLKHMLVHRHSMPKFYDIDMHTVEIFPPICNVPSLGLSTGKHFSNNTSNDIIASLPTYSCDDILDYSYPECNGKGKPESLSTFLLKADLEEEKDRTAGQPKKGIRGFNMPKRQY